VLADWCRANVLSTLETLKDAQRRVTAARTALDRAEAALEATEPGDLETRYRREDAADAARTELIRRVGQANRLRGEVEARQRFRREAMFEFAPWLSPNVERDVSATGEGDWLHAMPPVQGDTPAPELRMPRRWQAQEVKGIVCGPFKVLQQPSTGVWVVLDSRRPMGDQEVHREGPRDWRTANDVARMMGEAAGFKVAS
jgi:hypothetical protein